jgi:ArsR family transcriptional regulator
MKEKKQKNQAESLAEIFKALGDPTRLKIIRLLCSKEPMLCVGALAHELGISQPAVSQHLRILKNAGILRAHRLGLHVHYVFNPSMLHEHKEMIDALFHVAFECCEPVSERGSCCGSNKDGKCR